MRVKLTYLICYCQFLFVSAEAQEAYKTDSLKVNLDNSSSIEERFENLQALYNYYKQYDLFTALDYCLQAQQLAETEGKKELAAFNNIELGAVYYRLGRYDEALGRNMDALHYFNAHENSDPFARVRINNNIGILYDRLGDYDIALEYYFIVLNLINQGVEIPPRFGFPAGLYNNIASIYERKNEDEKAVNYYLKGLEEAEMKNDYIRIGEIANNLGKMHLLKLENSEMAYKYLTKSLDARKKINNQLGIAKSSYFLSSYYLNTNQPELAFSFANQAYEIAKELGNLETQVYALMFMSESAEAQNNLSESLEYFKLYKNLSDSIINIEKVREFSSLQKKFEMDELRKESMHEKQILKIRYTGLIIILILSITVITLLFINLRHKKNKIESAKNKLEEDIEVKNRELTTNVMYLVRKNELINNVAKKLVNLKEKLIPENRQPIQDIVFELNLEVDKDIWQDFEYRFNQVHSRFYEELRRKHNDLSPAEERLCAFLRLNLSSKEIAAITQQNARSVDVARARLRKKLNLTNTDANLVSYLSQL